MTGHTVVITFNSLSTSSKLCTSASTKLLNESIAGLILGLQSTHNLAK